MSRNELTHCRQDNVWGGCQRKANIFFAAVRPSHNMRLCCRCSPRLELSLSKSKVGDSGLVTSSMSLKVEHKCLQKAYTSGHSQNICKNDPGTLSVHRSQLGDGMNFMAWRFLGVRYILCIHLKCISWWLGFLEVSCRFSHTVSQQILKSHL